MNKVISDRITALPAMNKAQLLVVWAENFHRPPPPTLRKQLMVPILAYRIQEKEYGGLSHSARSKLRQIAKGFRAEKQSEATLKSNLKSGTRLIRSWGGEVHEVSISGVPRPWRISGYRLHIEDCYLSSVPKALQTFSISNIRGT